MPNRIGCCQLCVRRRTDVRTWSVNTRLQTDDLSARARNLHFSSLVIDTHDDTTQRFLDRGFDLGTRDPKGSIDIPRMKEGGLGAIFFSIWIPSKITGPDAVKRATDQIDAVRDAGSQAFEGSHARHNGGRNPRHLTSKARSPRSSASRAAT